MQCSKDMNPAFLFAKGMHSGDAGNEQMTGNKQNLGEGTNTHIPKVTHMQVHKRSCKFYRKRILLKTVNISKFILFLVNIFFILFFHEHFEIRSYK